MTAIAAFVVAAAVTYVLRSSMTVAGTRVAQSPRLISMTALVTPAVLASMIAAALFGGHGHTTTPAVAEVAAVVAAFVMARRTGNFGLALAVGMPVYWLASLAPLG